MKSNIFIFLVILISNQSFAKTEEYVWNTQVHFKTQKNDVNLWSQETPFKGGSTILLKQTLNINNPIIHVKDVQVVENFPCLKWVQTSIDDSECDQYASIPDGVTLSLSNPVVIATAKGEINIKGQTKTQSVNIIKASVLKELYVDDSGFDKTVFPVGNPDSFVTYVIPPVGVWGATNSTTINVQGKAIPVITGAWLSMRIYWKLSGDHYEVEKIVYPVSASFNWGLGGNANHFEEILSKDLF